MVVKDGRVISPLEVIRDMADDMANEGEMCPPDCKKPGVCAKFDTEDGCTSCIMDYYMNRRYEV